tara:strand:- start:20 stop:265 length:246 start_codon:yes stop_codon:yes gene_type:complete
MGLKNKTIIIKIFSISKIKFKSIQSRDILEDQNWDSLIIINLMTLFSKKYKIDLNPNDFKKLKTFGDLDKFLSKKLSNIKK